MKVKLRIKQREEMLDKFKEQVNKLLDEENYQEVYDLCQSELNRLNSKSSGFSDEERFYMANIYCILSQILQPEGALESLDCAINILPNNADLYMRRAIVKEFMQDFQGAIDDLTTVLEGEPKIEAYGRRGNLRANIGDLDGAAEDFKAIFKLNPDDIAAKRSYISIKNLQSQNGLSCMQCTLKTGEEVLRFIIDGDVIDIPAEQY